MSGILGQKEVVKSQFGRTAQSYVDSPTHANVDASELLTWLSPAQSWSILDVATGGGHMAKTLSPYVGTVYATDLTRPMLEAARQHLVDTARLNNVIFILADAESLPFLDCTFELVTCRIAAHHFSQPKVFLDEALRVLKPGGSLLLIDNVAPNDATLSFFLNTFERMRDPSHVRCLSREEWTSLFEQTGFSVVHSNIRRKQIGFNSWLKRMVQDPHQASAVEHYLKSAPETCKQAFSVNVDAQNDRVESLVIDEWSVHCIKAGP